MSEQAGEQAATPTPKSLPDKLRSTASYLMDNYEDLTKGEAQVVVDKLEEAAVALEKYNDADGLKKEAKPHPAGWPFHGNEPPHAPNPDRVSEIYGTSPAKDQSE